MPVNHTAAGLQVKIDMSIYDEYQIVITEAQRRSIVRALTNALANDRRSSDLTHRHQLNGCSLFGSSARLNRPSEKRCHDLTKSARLLAN